MTATAGVYRSQLSRSFVVVGGGLVWFEETKDLTQLVLASWWDYPGEFLFPWKHTLFISWISQSGARI